MACPSRRGRDGGSADAGDATLPERVAPCGQSEQRGWSLPTGDQHGFPAWMTHIVLDRDPLYTAAFRRLLRDGGVTPLVLPARSRNLNAFAERFVGSAKSECLDRVVLLGERHLHAAVREFVGHYHEERPQQGLKNELLAPQTTVIRTGRVKCRERLGGLLKFYYREAA